MKCLNAFLRYIDVTGHNRNISALLIQKDSFCSVDVRLPGPWQPDSIKRVNRLWLLVSRYSRGRMLIRKCDRHIFSATKFARETCRTRQIYPSVLAKPVLKFWANNLKKVLCSVCRITPKSDKRTKKLPQHANFKLKHHTFNQSKHSKRQTFSNPLPGDVFGCSRNKRKQWSLCDCIFCEQMSAMWKSYRIQFFFYHFPSLFTQRQVYFWNQEQRRLCSFSKCSLSVDESKVILEEVRHKNIALSSRFPDGTLFSTRFSFFEGRTCGLYSHLHAFL